MKTTFRAQSQIPPSAFLILVVLLVQVVGGCARFSTKQTDISTTNPYGEPERKITTKATSYTLFSSKSDLANFKATQTDKSQSASVGTLSQQGGTNTAQVLSAIVQILQAVK